VQLRFGIAARVATVVQCFQGLFSEDTSASRTGSGPANLATIRAAIIAAIKDAGYLHVPEGRRDPTTPAETLRLHSLD
jgi:hypothetical protein